MALIERLRAILASDKLVLEEIRRELAEIKEYGDKRRTEIIPETHEISIEDLIADEDMVITVTHTGYIKRRRCRSTARSTAAARAGAA